MYEIFDPRDGKTVHVTRFAFIARLLCRLNRWCLKARGSSQWGWDWDEAGKGWLNLGDLDKFFGDVEENF